MKNIELGVALTILFAVVGGAVAWGTTQNKVENVDKKVEKHDGKIDKLEEYSIRQSVLMEKMNDSLERQIQLYEKIQERPQ